MKYNGIIAVKKVVITVFMGSLSPLSLERVMMLNITVAEIKKIVNLEKVAKDDLISNQLVLIDSKIRSITKAETYESVEAETADDTVITSFKTAFSYLLFTEIMPFLNINTAGSGIVKSTGFLESKIDLLSNEETSKRQQNIELNALKIIKPYLNDTGISRLDKLVFWDELSRVDVDNIEAKASLIDKKSSPRKCKMAII